jgi:hypothetical protein
VSDMAKISIAFDPPVSLPARAEGKFEIDHEKGTAVLTVTSVDSGLVRERREGFILRKESRPDGELWVMSFLPEG